MMTPQDSFQNSAKRIESYAESLERFGGDAVVAARLVQVRKTLLTRSGDLSGDTVERLIDAVRRTSANSRDVAEAFEQALRPTKPGGTLEALARFNELLGTIRNDPQPDPGTHATLAKAAEGLATQWRGTHPALLFSLWSDAARAIGEPAKDATTFEAWCVACESFVESLYKSDTLAAFLVWCQVIEWSKHQVVVPAAWLKLLQATYVLIGEHGPDEHQINQLTWEFVRSADDLRRDDSQGATARQLSVSAALDLATALQREPARTSTRDSILAALKRNDYLPVNDQGRVQPNWDAINANASFRKDIETFDAPIDDILRVAETWLGDPASWPPGVDLVPLLTASQKLAKTTLLLSPSTRRFMSTVTNLEHAVRDREISSAATKITIGNQDSAWVAPPLVALPWRELVDHNEIRQLLASFVRADGALPERFSVEKVRVASPTFYHGSTFVEAQLHTADGVHGILFGMVLPTRQAAVFDGKSNIVHAVNNASWLSNMDKARSVLDYLLFFCASVWGDEGPFSIVRQLQDIPRFETLKPELIDEIGAVLIQHPTATEDVDRSWRVNATVHYAYALFNVVFHIKRDGNIEMLADDSKITGLPTFNFTMAGPIRVPKT